MSNTSQKYFYTILFLDNYKVPENSVKDSVRVQLPELKTYKVKCDTDTQVMSWEKASQSDQKKYKLVIRHGMKLPITLQMWNSDDQTIVYCPLVNELKQSVITNGNVIVQNSTTISIIFNQDDCKLPEQGQVFTLSIKTVPEFDTRSKRLQDSSATSALDQLVGGNQTGLALVFRRNNLDTLYDLIADIDESYMHSMVQGYDLKYMLRQSKYQNAKFMVKYTNNLQDVIDQIDSQVYQTKFSWSNL